MELDGGSGEVGWRSRYYWQDGVRMELDGGRWRIRMIYFIIKFRI
jgi:hypothetical protein